MSLASRVILTGPPATEPEDILSASLSALYPDDAPPSHGDAEHGIAYVSPHVLPRSLTLALAPAGGETNRSRYAHYVWNAALLMAELIETGPSSHFPSSSGSNGEDGVGKGREGCNVAGLAVLEVGAGAGLPSIVAALLGAARVVASDYPSAPGLGALRQNVGPRNVCVENMPPSIAATTTPVTVEVAGHEWGDDDGSDGLGQHMFDVLLAADCLWMPAQHDPLRRSIARLLATSTTARAWVVAGFHTGRAVVRKFLDPEALAATDGGGLEIHRIWERDCDGAEREWAWDRGIEDVRERNRWTVVAVLRRVRKEKQGQ